MHSTSVKIMAGNLSVHSPIFNNVASGFIPLHDHELSLK